MTPFPARVACLYLLTAAFHAGACLASAFEDGVQALRAGRPEEARARLEEAVGASPADADAWWELGWACWSTEDYSGAVKAWQTVSRLDPTRAELSQWLTAAEARSALATAPKLAVDVPLTPTERRVHFAAAGDTMMGSDLARGPAGLAPGNGESIFTDVAPIFKAADIAFLNLEGPLADGLESKKCRPDSTSCYAFRTPTRYAAALRSAGIDVTSIANNHASDLGPEGQQSTMDALDAVGIAHAGRYGDNASLVVNGVRIAVVAAHFGSCCLNINNLSEIQAAIAAADADHDVVVFSFHGGAEGGGAQHVPGQVEVAWGEQRGDVRALSRAAVDAGADLVFGHGPHVLRAMEVYRSRLIAYSLGNFTGYKQFGTGGGPTGTTVILEVHVADNGVLTGARLHPIRLDEQSVPHPDTEGKAGLTSIRDLSAADFPETGVRVTEDGTVEWGR